MFCFDLIKLSQKILPKVDSFESKWQVEKGLCVKPFQTYFGFSQPTWQLQYVQKMLLLHIFSEN